MKTMNEGVIASTYQKMLIKAPNRSANSIIKHFHGTEFAMRRDDALKLIKELKRTGKETSNLVKRNEASDMPASLKARLYNESKIVARKEALHVSKENSKLKSRRASVKGKISGTVEDFRSRIYKRVDATADYVEFYG